MKPFLQVDNLSWHIHNRPLINQLSFELPEKSVTAIVGPNGAGKTSILRCIYGAIKPSSGEIRMQGENIIAIPDDAEHNRLPLSASILNTGAI
nr:ABC transporter ATP-binding protein [Catenovulum sediminis]